MCLRREAVCVSGPMCLRSCLLNMQSCKCVPGSCGSVYMWAGTSWGRWYQINGKENQLTHIDMHTATGYIEYMKVLLYLYQVFAYASSPVYILYTYYTISTHTKDWYKHTKYWYNTMHVTCTYNIIHMPHTKVWIWYGKSGKLEYLKRRRRRELQAL